MKLSTKGRYGLRALIDLAKYSEIEPVPINSIAARQGISERYLEQLMALLKKGGAGLGVSAAPEEATYLPGRQEIYLSVMYCVRWKESWSRQNVPLFMKKMDVQHLTDVLPNMSGKK